MSEENKTGENLVDQVEQETAETKEEAGFDPQAFNAQEGQAETKNETEQEVEEEGEEPRP